jgi:NAD+ synthase
VNCQDVYLKIIKEMVDYIRESELKCLVLGVSGGIDSALVAALSYQVCKELNIPLIGRSIPIHTNKEDELERSNLIGNSFCANYKVKDLTSLFFKNKDEIIDEDLNLDYNSKEYKIACGNLKARMRMTYLYNVAYFNKGMVLSTDNYTEYALGFWTLHGDVGDFGPIQSLKKSEVYELSKWIAQMYFNVDAMKVEALQKCIDAVPTDGLGITNSDMEQLEVSTYEEVDEILDQWLLGCPSNVEVKIMTSSVVKRYEQTHFKRNNPYNLSRNDLGLDVGWGI